MICSGVSSLDGAFRSRRGEAGCHPLRWDAELEDDGEGAGFRVDGRDFCACLLPVVGAVLLSLDADAEPQQGCQSRSASWIQSSQLPNGDVILPWHRGGEMLTKTTLNVPRPRCECTQKGG